MSSNYVKVEEHPDLVRDNDSNAILNTNNEALLAYKKRKKHFNKIQNMDDRMNYLDERLINIENLFSVYKFCVLNCFTEIIIISVPENGVNIIVSFF